MILTHKYTITLIVLSSIITIIYGFTVIEENPPLGNKCIGFGTVGLFLIAMPLFLFKESKGKKMKDYMLTEENIKKMRNTEEKSQKNDNSSPK